MKLKRNTKIGKESTCRFNIDIKNMTNFEEYEEYDKL